MIGDVNPGLPLTTVAQRAAEPQPVGQRDIGQQAAGPAQDVSGANNHPPHTERVQRIGGGLPGDTDLR